MLVRALSYLVFLLVFQDYLCEGDECDEVIDLSQLQVGNLSINGTGPDNVTISAGYAAVFNCTTTYSDAVKWLIDCSDPTVFDGKVTVNGTQLIIADVTPSQNGVVVTCFVNSTMGVFKSSAYLTVTYLAVGPVEPVPPQEIGNNVTLVCNTSGNPEPSIVWYHNSILQVEASNNELVISEITSDRGGNYSCTASNVAGNETSSVQLTVKPFIQLMNSSVSFVEGDDVVINCTVQAYPVPSVQWIQASSGVELAQQISPVLLLNFTNISSSQAGNYTCSANDTVGISYTASVNIDVLTYPKAPVYLMITEVGDTWMYVQWEKNTQPSNPPVTGYNISWVLIGTGVGTSQFVSTMQTDPQPYSFNITSLTPGSEYRVTVHGVSGLGSGPASVEFKQTSFSSSPSVSSTLSPSQSPADDNFVGTPWFIAVVCIVAVLLVLLLILSLVIIIYCCMSRRSQRMSVTLMEDSSPVVERKRSRKATSNVERRGSFRLSLRRKTVVDPVNEFRKVSILPAMESHPPIPVSAFLYRLQQMRMNDNQLFMEEFGSISMEPQFPREAADLPHNKEKNRYDNILPYDTTRVKLQSVRWQEGSDYINGNYCDGYQKSKAYIATQGPTPTTLFDFWRMIWEENARTIVMVTNTHEKATVKCEAYWPSECFRPTLYGQIEVTLQQYTPLADFTIRIFCISKPGSQKESREVHQFHFTSWPDHGVPQFPTAMLAMNRCVRAHHNKLSVNSPMVVHCSAGVGRTGTFIVMDSTIQRLRNNEEYIDIYAHVSLLRTQRNFMVQTEDQYFFIHEAVAEVVASGVTEVTVEDFPEYLEKLEQEEAEVTRLEREFQLLETNRTEPHRFASATKDVNKEKNRFYNLMPYEYNRVKLQMIRAVNGSDYINASFIDSYRQQRAFISTQGPLKNTVKDLWRMIWEQKSPIIVMLTKLEERKQERCSCYWPLEHTKSYGDVTVELTLERILDNYMYREFTLTHTESPDSHTLRQFQFLGWPERGVPPTGRPLIELLQEVQKVYNSLETTAPITVMCSTGVGRSGVFISLHIVLERLHIEGLIDVFQTVKMLRIQKPAMVQSLDFYQFCYNAVLDYLQQSGRLKRGRCTSIDRKATVRNITSTENSTNVYTQGQADPMQASTFGRSVNGTSNLEDEEYRDQPL